MSMTANKVLDRVEELGMLEPKLIVELRRQVAESKFHISAEAIVKLLVDKKHLTQFQAKKLISEVTTEPPPSEAAPAAPSPARPATPANRGPSAVQSHHSDDLLDLEGAGSSGPQASVTDDDIVDLEVALPPAQPLKAAVKPLAPPSGDVATGKSKTSAASTKKSTEERWKTSKPPVEEEEIVSLEAVDSGSPISADVNLFSSALTREIPPPAGLTPLSRTNALAPSPFSPTAMPPDSGLSPMAEGLSPLGGGLSPMGGGFTSLGPGLAPMSGGDALFGGGGFDGMAAPPGAPSVAEEPDRKIKKKRLGTWDSPLLLAGGGGLGVMLIAFVILYFALTRGSAEELFAEALQSYRDASYATSIQLFQKFTAKYPDDPNASAARVKIGLARIRQNYDGAKDMSRALDTAKTVLLEIEGEPQFDEARSELESILPSIADNFATQARSATDLKRMKKQVELAQEAMKLVSNASYLPSSRRKNQETKIESIQEKIRVAERAIHQDQALATSMEELQTHLKAGDIVAAYRDRETLLQDYPTLAKDPVVMKNTLAISQRERDLVTNDAPAQAAATDDPHKSPFPQVTLARRSGDTVPAPANATAYLPIGGDVYAIDVASGKMRWKRFVGFADQANPVSIGGDSGDVLVADGRHHELLRLEAATGKVLWRQELDEGFSAPLVYGEHAFATLNSGRLVQIALATGEILRAAVLPQAARVTPAVDTRKKLLYQPASHSTLFALTADDSQGEPLACQSAYYLGHRRGSIVVPPVVVVGYVFVFENTGVDSSLVHVLAPSDKAPLAPVREAFRLRGQITVSPTSAGRRLVVVSNLGDTLVLDVDPNNEQSPLTVTAKMVGGLSQATLGYPVIAGSRLLIADTRLADYEIVATRQALDRGKSSFDGDAFVTAPKLFDNTLVHARRRQRSQSVTITGVALNNDQSWQLEVAAPLTGVFAFPEQKRFSAITTSGDLFNIPLDDLKSGLRDVPSASPRGTLPETYSDALPLPEARYLVPERQGRRWLIYNPAGDGTLQKIDLQVPEPLAAAPTPFAGGVLAALNTGAIWHLDAASGAAKDNAVPFQPEVAPGAKVQWLPPLAIDERQFIAVDSKRKLLFLARREEKPQPFLAESRRIELTDEPAAVAVVGKTLLLASHKESADEVVAYALPSMATGKTLALTGRIGRGGFYTVGSNVFCETGDGKLLCLNDANDIVWELPLAGKTLATAPMANGSDWILVFSNGVVLLAKGATGEAAEIVDAGLPLRGRARVFGPRMVVGSESGSLLILPAKPETK